MIRSTIYGKATPGVPVSIRAPNRRVGRGRTQTRSPIGCCPPSPAAAARVAEILGPGADMPSIASWADQVRNSRKETGPWHYIDVPVNKPHVDLKRDCPDGNCVIPKIDQFERTVADARATPLQRREALMYLIHLVGDMHQPLHCSDNADKGGNDIKLAFLGRPTNLHSLWDTGLTGADGRGGSALRRSRSRPHAEKDQEIRQGRREKLGRAIASGSAARDLREAAENYRRRSVDRANLCTGRRPIRW